MLILKKLMLRIDINFWSQERKRCYLTSLKGKGIQNRHFLVVIMLEIAQHFLLLLAVAYYRLAGFMPVAWHWQHPKQKSA